MATGPWHYQEAERLLRVADGPEKPLHAAAYRASAHVHALLSLAAATALGTWNETGMPQPGRMDWWRAASGEPAERERVKKAEAAEAAEFAAEVPIP